MNCVFASDIHGNAKHLEQVVDYCLKNNSDRLILTGDICGFFAGSVAKALEPVKNITSAVLGNCDNESYIAALGIYYESDYGVLRSNGVNIFYTHGHIYNQFNLPPGMSKGDILISGHTHIPSYIRRYGYVFLNPGSVSKPRGGMPKSFMIYDGETFKITDFNETIIISTT